MTSEERHRKVKWLSRYRILEIRLSAWKLKPNGGGIWRV